MNNPKDLSNVPYASWLEQALQELINFPVKGICLNVTADTGEVYTNYYEISMRDKLTIAGLMQQDAMLDTMEANGLIEHNEE